ncbi:MAG: TonB-dependent receptor plug domain-containing protein [Bacteroidales bacterium]|nr:TonB-dependent receptor plug domain-containing protein [Bacteroidales bacterium]
MKFSVSGNVTDDEGEALIGVNVYTSDKSAGTVTNEYGFYSIKLPEGKHTLIYSFIGYNQHEERVDLNQNKKLNIRISEETKSIEEVVVSAKRPDGNVTDLSMSTIQLQPQTIKKITVLMGETDIIKSIQLLPGVQTSVEGSSGFYVRGGNADQNLVLLDGATVYNPSHLFGFFSVFNNDAVKGIQLYKGGIPSEYGGRLSSVLDVRMKEGNTQKFHGTGGIGIISSRGTFEGPILKNRSSFIISARRTYADLFCHLLLIP